MSNPHYIESTISFYWRRGYECVLVKHIETLNQDAVDRIADCVKEGYVSGELCSTVDEIEYSGLWSLHTKEVYKNVD